MNPEPVVGFEDDTQRHLVVRFDHAGERRLATELVRRAKLLEARPAKARERRGQRVKSSLGAS